MKQQELIAELQFKAIRSSGPGGQHVNKVSSKVVLSFHVLHSNGLSDKEKELLLLKLKNRLTKEGLLVLQCDEARSQHKNKELVIKRFLTLLKNALVVPKKRKATKPSRIAIEKRLKSKKKAALKKTYRKKPNLE